MNGLLCSAAFLLLVSLAGCGGVKLFNAHPAPEVAESAGVAEAPWPRLVDTPAVPVKGTYSTTVPDPAAGAALAAELGRTAREAAARAEVLNQPILTEAERRRLTRKR